jgi:hypothetical protein
MILFEIYDYFGCMDTHNRCFKGNPKKAYVPPPVPVPVPQEAEANAAKRDIEESNLRKRGRVASRNISPGLLLTAPNLNLSGLKDKLGG